MQRILFTFALLALAPACVHAQAAPKPDATPAATPRKSHNPFGEAILELTRVAREQSAAAKSTAASPSPAARTEHATNRTATKPVVAPVATASAPVLADSNRP